MNAPLLSIALALFSGPAQAAKLVRCEATLERSVGAVAVPGWGADEEVARRRARDAAWLLAWADRWPMLAAGTVAAPIDTARRDQALRDLLDPQTDWRVPGYAVRLGQCTTETVTGPKGDAWAARWEREDRKVIRDDPGTAVEAARRRQCWGTWSHRMVGAAELASAATEERFAASWPGARAATDGLFRCVTAVIPDLQPATGALERVTDPGTVMCARPRRLEGRWTAAPAWGPELETAREAALQLDLGSQLRRLEATALKIAAAPAVEDRATGVAGAALAGLGGLVVATDLAEQAMLSCVTAAPKAARPTWTPPDGLVCPGWPTGAAAALSPDQLEAARESRCEPAFRQSAKDAWGMALSCSVSCRTDVVAAGWNGKSVWRASEPSRASVEDAEKLLSAALKGEDFHLLGIATGGLIFEAQFAAAFKANPSAFWGSIGTARDSGSWNDLAYWEQVSGAWVLAFRETAKR